MEENEVFDYMRKQYKVVETVNGDKYKLPEYDVLWEKTDAEINRLKGYYEENNLAFFNFIEGVKKERKKNSQLHSEEE